MATGTSAKLQATPAVNEAVRARVAQVTAPKTDIQANPVFQIMTNKELQPEQKVAALSGMLSPETREEAKSAISAVESYKEYLAAQRTALHKKLLELASTTTFAKTKMVIDSMYQGVVDFQNLQKPLTDNLQAIFTLRTNGEMLNAIKEIDEERRLEADWDKREGDVQSRVKQIQSDTAKLTRDIAVLQSQTGWFGGLKRGVQEQITEKQLLIDKMKNEVSDLSTQLEVVLRERKEYENRQGKFMSEKKQLKEMLNISGPETVKMVENIINKAISYIEESKKTVGEVRDELVGLDEQADNLVNVNGRMTTIAAILDKGVSLAEVNNNKRREALATPAPDEDTLARVERERKKNEVERFIGSLRDSSIATKNMCANLEKDAVNATNFRETVGVQISSMRELHSEGIATIASNLCTSVNDEMNKRIIEKFESLEKVNEALQAANKLWADGISNVQASLAKLQETSENMRASLQQQIGAAADATGTPTTRSTPVQPTEFGI